MTSLQFTPCNRVQCKIPDRQRAGDLISIFQSLIDQLVEDVKHVRPAVEKTRPNVVKNPDVDRLEEDVNRMAKRWGNCCMQVIIMTAQSSLPCNQCQTKLFNPSGCGATAILRGGLRAAGEVQHVLPD